MSTALAQVASRLSVSEDQLKSIVVNTVMPSGKQVTNEQFLSFIAVANEYRLNPLVKEIYAFPAKGGGIQPIVSIDGWLKIINTNAQFDGMEHEDILNSDGKLTAVKCSIFRKDTKKPVTITEYMEECKGNSEPWRKWPARMLRHKATIQCGRYAFGISGIIDPDEAERFADAGVIEKDMFDIKDKAAEYIDADQAKKIRDLIASVGETEQRFCAKAGIDSLEFLQAERYEGSVNFISSIKPAPEAAV